MYIKKINFIIRKTLIYIKEISFCFYLLVLVGCKTRLQLVRQVFIASAVWFVVFVMQQ